MKAPGFHLESAEDGQHSAFQSDLLITSIDKHLCFIFGLSLSILQCLQTLFPVTPSFSIFSRKTLTSVTETSRSLHAEPGYPHPGFSVLTWKMLSPATLATPCQISALPLVISFVLKRVGRRAVESVPVLQPEVTALPAGQCSRGTSWDSTWGEAGWLGGPLVSVSGMDDR